MALSRSDADAIRDVVARLRAEHADREAAVIERLMEQALGAPDSTALAGYMTTGEAAGLIGVSLQTIKNWVHQGRLVGTRVGGRTLVTRASVQAFFDSLGSATEPAESDEDMALAEVADGELAANLPAGMVQRVEELLERADSGQKLSSAERQELRRLARTGTAAATRHTRELVSRLRHA